MVRGDDVCGWLAGRLCLVEMEMEVEVEVEIPSTD